MRPVLICTAASLLLASACASRSTAPPSTSAASPASRLGKFVWHDLSTDDLPAARRFYGDLLGWQFRDTTRMGRPYVVANYQGKTVGGLVGVDPVEGREVSQWVAYASVANVDATVAAFENAGGRTLVSPVDVDGAGRAAVVVDPQGAPLGLVRLAGGDPADPAAPQERTFFWMEYLARDPRAAVGFYTSTFGYERKVTASVGSNDYVVLSRGRPRGGILQAPRPEMRPVWLPYVLVSDPGAMASRAKSLGGTVLLEPQADVRNGSLAVVADPSGAIVALQKFPF